MKQLNWTGILLTLGVSASLALAAEPTLKVGDPAPKLQTGKWEQGEPVKDFEKNKAYIVEFWATWCGPCRISIPHLNEIHNKYKDKGLVVIGQDCWERDDTLVAPFVKKMDDKMTYRVAMDDKTEEKGGAMAKTWMAAAGRGGIPSAFLVDKEGTIAWIGHPMQLKESVIEDVLAGNFDIKKAAQVYDQEQRDARMMADFRTLIRKKDYQAAYALAKSLSDTNRSNAMLQNELAWQIATDKSITQRDLGLAETIATRANEAADGKNPVILDTLARVLFLHDKKDQAIATQQKAVELADGDSKAELQKSLDSYKRGELSKSN